MAKPCFGLRELMRENLGARWYHRLQGGPAQGRGYCTIMATLRLKPFMLHLAGCHGSHAWCTLPGGHVNHVHGAMHAWCHLGSCGPTAASVWGSCLAFIWAGAFPSCLCVLVVSRLV